MANTTNFNWATPDDTDLVKDGAAAIRTLGSSIDTSFVDLKGGTTGQNLRKASNTDLDFTFAGDATNTVIDAAGDLLYGTAADTLGRLAIGSAGQVLKVNSGATAPEWGAASTSKVVQIVTATTATEVSNSTTTFADTTLTATITPTSASNKVLVMVNQNGVAKTDGSASNRVTIELQRGATTILTIANEAGATGTALRNNIGSVSGDYLDSPATTSATTYKTRFKNGVGASAAVVQEYLISSTIVLMEVTP